MQQERGRQMSPSTILPEIILVDADINRVTAPRKRWRIIGGALSRFKNESFGTQAERDHAAQKLADESREHVICEFWSFSNPQDSANGGWASDGSIHPSRKDS